MKRPTFLQITSIAAQTKPATKMQRPELLKTSLSRVILVALLTYTGAATLWAQGDIPSGTLTSSGSGPSYTYNLSFTDGALASSPIGSVWYAWIPGQFFLPGTPTGASAPFGWTATVSGDSVQFVASSSIYDITPGHSLSGFSYTATFTPAQLASAPNSGESDAYTGGLFSDGGQIFTVQTVPEPSILTLLGVGLGLLWARQRAVA